VNSVQDKVNNLFANGVMPTGIVIGSMSLCDELLRVEKLVIGTCVNFINDYDFQECKHFPGTFLPVPVSLMEVLKASSPPLMV
jgi:hypothetical protein